MATHNADNERIKRKYLAFLKQAKGQSEDSVDAVAKALARFEAATRYRDFKAFHFEQAVAFKKHLADQETWRLSGKEGVARTTYRPGPTLPVRDGQVVVTAPEAPAKS
jgi:hypothetical protein